MKCSAHFAVGVGSLAFWLKYNYSGHIKHSPSDWSIGAMPKPSIREGMDELLLTVEQAGAFNSFNPSECLSAMILLYCDYHCCKLWPRSAWLISQNVLVNDRTHPPPHDLLHLCLLHTFVTPCFFQRLFFTFALHPVFDMQSFCRAKGANVPAGAAEIAGDY